MRRRAEPCRTLLVNIHMYARARMHARGFWSQGNRFGRYGRFGKRLFHRMCWMGNASDAATSPHVCAVLRSVLAFGQVRHRHQRINTGERGVSTCQPPSSRYLAENGKEDWSVGTVALLTTVCFPCPTFSRLGAMGHVDKEGRQGGVVERRS